MAYRSSGLRPGLRIILIRQKVTSEDFVREVKTLFNDLFYGHGLVVNLGRKRKPGGIVLRCARL